MFRDTAAFSGFSVDDIGRAREFYGGTLGLEVTEPAAGMPLLELRLGGGGTVMLYEKRDHEPATFTVLNFPVADLVAAVDALTAAGVRMQTYAHIGGADERGIHRGAGGGPDIAWFTDPAGNVLAVMAEPRT